MTSANQVSPVLRVPTFIKCCYGIGSVGTATFFVIPQLLLLFFMTEILAIPAGWASVAILGPRIWEAVTDPIIGHWSDKSSSRWGRRKPFMLAGCVVFAVSFYLMFAVPEFEDWQARFFYVAAMFAICTTAYTVFSVPYIAMPAEMTSDYHERTSIVSYRMVFVSIGVLLSGALSPFIVESVGGQAGYLAMGMVFAVLSLCVMLVSIFGTRRAKFTVHQHSSLSVKEQIRLGLENIAFIQLLSVFVLQMLAVSLTTVMLPYFAKYLIPEIEDSVTIFFVVLTITTLLSMPAWLAISNRYGKKKAFMISTSIQIASLCALFFVPDMGLTFFVLVSVAVGLGNAGVQLFPFAMLPDVIDLDKARTKQNREGVFTGIWVAAEKLGLALAAGFAGIALGASGFVQSANSYVPQGSVSVWVILMMISLVPAMLLILSFVPLSLYQDKQPILSTND